MPLNSTIKTPLEEVARPVWLLGADGQPMGVVGNLFYVAGLLMDADGNVIGTNEHPIVVDADVTDREARLLGTVGIKGYRYTDGTYQPLRLDRCTNTLQTIDYVHHEIHNGAHYFVTDYQTIGNGNSVDWMLTTPNVFKWGHLTFEVQGTAVTTAVLYEGGDRTGVAGLAIQRNNRNIGPNSILTVYRGTVGGTTDGTAIWQMSGGSAVGQFRGGPDIRDDTEIILKQNAKYILRVTSGTAGNIVDVRFRWYEHTDLWGGA